ncbi:MAG TPA: FtsX-like permease family protein, partial [Vicinamibacterales bacterium]|nr:FtsX-like permease family protein [Vicinamibacterales bacterium]
LASADVYTPLHMNAANLPLPAATLVVAVGRLGRGVTPEGAGAEAAAVMTDVVKEAPDTYKGWSAGAMPLREALSYGAAPVLTLLFVAILCVTSIACANLANVTIAEVTGRRDEITLRTALGASRLAVVQLLAIEHVLVAIAGGAIGLVASGWVLPAVLALDPNTAAQLGEVSIDWRVEAGALMLALVVSVISGVLPALAGTRGDLARGLALGGRRTAGSRRQARARAWLVAIETLVASVLLGASAVFLTAFGRAAATPPGFDPDHVLATQLRLPALTYPTAEARADVVTRLIDAVRALPGVVDASVTNPLSAGGGYQTGLHVEGHPTPDGRPHTVQFRRVSPGYFHTLRIPHVRGRLFTDTDGPLGQPVAIVSQSFATAFWPGEDPIGRRVIRTPDPTHPLTIVGIVGDVSDTGLAVPPPPTLYIAYAQNNSSAAPLALLARTVGDPHGMVRALTQAIHGVDRSLPLSRSTTMSEFLAESLGPDRFRSVLLLAFAAVGLALAAIGIYGVTSRGVTERTRELGVRLALGSGRAELWRLVLGQALAAVAVGLVVSVPATIILLKLLGHWLPDVSDVSPLIPLPAAGVLAIAGLVAAAVPAWRAARLDPVIALRAE